jgi:hypothetical protein
VSADAAPGGFGVVRLDNHDIACVGYMRGACGTRTSGVSRASSWCK